MNKKSRLFAIIVFAIASIISIVRVIIDFSYGVDNIGSLIPALDIGSAAVWAICMGFNLVQYCKKNK